MSAAVCREMFRRQRKQNSKKLLLASRPVLVYLGSQSAVPAQKGVGGTAKELSYNKLFPT